MFFSFPVVKLVAHAVASVGVDKIVGDIIKSNVTARTTADAVKILAGRIVLTSLVADVASKHVVQQMNELSKMYSEFKEKNSTPEEE